VSNATTPPPPSPPPPSTGSLSVAITQPTNGTVVSGTNWAVIWVSGTTGSSNVYTLTAGDKTVGTMTTASTGPVSIPWNTASVANGSQVLTASVRDAGGRTGTTSRTVTVSNGTTAPPPPPTSPPPPPPTSPPPPPPPTTGSLSVAITQPTNGTAVSGTNWAVIWVSGTTGSSNVYTLTVGGKTVATTTTASTGPVSIAWNTASVPNGSQVLTATVRDAGGRTGTTSRAVTVSNGTTPTPTPPPAPTGMLKVYITQPTGGATVGGTAWVVMWADGSSGSANTFTLSVDGATVYTETTASRGPVTLPWTTTAATNGTHSVRATVRDATGNAGSTAVSVTVRN
jgi:Bacterial Ig domain